MCLIRGNKDFTDVYVKTKQKSLSYFSNLTSGHLETSDLKKTTFIYKRIRTDFKMSLCQVLYQSSSHLSPLWVTLATVSGRQIYKCFLINFRGKKN